MDYIYASVFSYRDLLIPNKAVSLSKSHAEFNPLLAKSYAVSTTTALAANFNPSFTILLELS